MEAAAENYFGKHAKDLNLAECAILAGLPQAPSRYSPFQFPDRAKQRQIYTLNRMKEEGMITNVEVTEAIDMPLDIKPRKNWFIERVPFYTEHVRRHVEKKYGAEVLYNQGLQIHTAVNIEFQKMARDAVQKGLLDLDQRIGYRGPSGQLLSSEIESFCAAEAKKIQENLLNQGGIYTGVVLDVDDKREKTDVQIGNFKGIIRLATMTWARRPDPKIAYYESKVTAPSQVLRPGDVIQIQVKTVPEDGTDYEFTLYQEPLAQTALLSIEAETGHVKAMIGGRDFRDSQFNRAYQSRRQPGSAFKPIIYAAALDKGYTPATVILDSPVVYEDADRNFIWKPQNYAETFYGPTLFREAWCIPGMWSPSRSFRISAFLM